MNHAYFLDANAVFKYYWDEDGSEWVRQLVDNAENGCFISEWSVVEFISAFRKKIHEVGKPAQDERKQTFYVAYRQLQQDILAQQFRIMPIPPQWRAHVTALMIGLAIDPLNITERPALTAPDALQFATFQQLIRSFPHAALVTNDKKLIKVAELKQVTVINPQ